MVNLLCLFFHIPIALSISDFYYIITETNFNTTLTRLHISLVHIFPFKIYLENAKKNSCLPLPIVSISSKFGTSAKYKEDFEIPWYCCSICFHLLKFCNTDIYVTGVMINIWHEHTEIGMKKFLLGETLIWFKVLLNILIYLELALPAQFWWLWVLVKAQDAWIWAHCLGSFCLRRC